MNRRQLIGSMVHAGACSAVAPYVFSKRRRKLRVLGTHVTLQEPIRRQAEKDLGISIEFQPGGSAEIVHRASTKPETFDLYEQWSNSIRVLWQAGTIQPIDVKRLTYWNEINDLTKTGRLNGSAQIGAGDAPHKLLFVQNNGELDSNPTGQISFLPYVHNVDSFGYNSSVVPKGIPYQTESWGWLLDPKWKGRVAIINEPTIGLFDMALAAQSLGMVTFENIGNMTRGEVDSLFKLLIDLRREGQFRGVWGSVPRSVELMRDGEVVIESMFSPAVFSLRASGIDCVYASPKEGYRGWHGVMCMSSATQGSNRDAAYEYMNWWLSGWPGSFIARQGYYISNPDRIKPFLSKNEWEYWYEGKPATSDLKGTDGQVVVKKGRIRDGGSYNNRFSNVAVWNTVMDTYEYTLSAWNEFLSAA